MTPLFPPSACRQGESCADSSICVAPRPGELLVADGGMLDPPACLDVCALYGRSNPSLVTRLLRSLGELDGGAAGLRLAVGLEESGLAAARALAEVHAKVRTGRPLGLARRFVEFGGIAVDFVEGCVRSNNRRVVLLHGRLTRPLLCVCCVPELERPCCNEGAACFPSCVCCV